MDVRKHCPSQGLGWDNFISQKHGFTLIELLITLSVISIIALTSIPSLSSMVSQNRMVVATNTLAGALAYARSEAVMRGENVVTCQSNNQSECHRSKYWHNGYIIFVDKNRNKQREADEPLLRIISASNNGTEVTFRGSSRIRHYMKYKPTGQASPNGTFRICPSNSNSRNALIMTHSGRLRLSKTLRDGSPVTCN